MKTTYKTTELHALNELRKWVYFLSENINLQDLWHIRANSGIEHLAIRGDSNKQAIINMMIDCQKRDSLKSFIEGLVQYGIVGRDFIDLSYFNQCNYELPNIEILSFDIPRDTSCMLKDSSEGSLYHKPTIIRIPNKSHKCTFEDYCCVCGKKLDTKVLHEWGEWEYLHQNSCKQQRVCSLCGEKETRTHHSWTTWSKNKNGSQYRICSHCEEEEYNIDGNWYGFVNWENGTKDFWEVVIKTSGFLFESTKAEIKVYVNVNCSNQCEYIVTQKASVKVIDNEITIKGKKILSTTGSKKNYLTDTFIGVVSHNCQTIEGTVNDKSSRGTLKLGF